MESRLDKYKDIEYEPSRVEKNKDLYKMIYSAYDEYENYKVPLEEKEIDLTSIKKDTMSRGEYQRNYVKLMEEKKEKEILNLDNNYNSSNEVYDIKKLLDKVKEENPEERKTTIREEKYLDRLHLKDNIKTNLEKIKEEYDDVKLDSDEEEKLSNTANLSLEILSDLKSNENTLVSPPMKEDDEEDDIPFKKVEKEESKEEKTSIETKEMEDSFYSDMYKFKKKDFEDEDDDSLLDDEIEEGNNKFLFKILIIISIIILMALIMIYLVGYFSK